MTIRNGKMVPNEGSYYKQLYGSPYDGGCKLGSIIKVISYDEYFAGDHAKKLSDDVLSRDIFFVRTRVGVNNWMGLQDVFWKEMACQRHFVEREIQ